MRRAYFAYGSNVEAGQMARRCPDAVDLGAVSLPGWRLTFAGWSKGWQGGVATILPSSDHEVLGRLWAVTESDIRALDVCEGVPVQYDRMALRVRRLEHLVNAQVYLMPQRRQVAAPSPLYVRRIADGYSQIRLDEDPLWEAVEAAIEMESKI